MKKSRTLAGCGWDRNWISADRERTPCGRADREPAVALVDHLHHLALAAGDGPDGAACRAVAGRDVDLAAGGAQHPVVGAREPVAVGRQADASPREVQVTCAELPRVVAGRADEHVAT